MCYASDPVGDDIDVPGSEIKYSFRRAVTPTDLECTILTEFSYPKIC